MSILNQSVKKVIDIILVGGDVTAQADDGASTVPLVDLQALLEEERAGKNRKTLIKWLEEQDAQSVGGATADDETVDASVPEVEPVYVEPSPPVEPPEDPPVSFLAKGVLEYGESEYAISVLIAILSEKRDMIQRSRSCGLENIRVHLAGIKITVR